MVILDIKMLSGFAPDPESLKRVSYYNNFQLEMDLCYVLLTNDPAEYRILTAQRCPAGGSC